MWSAAAASETRHSVAGLGASPVSDSERQPELSALVEGQRRLEVQLGDIRRLLEETLEAGHRPCFGEGPEYLQDQGLFAKCAADQGAFAESAEEPPGRAHRKYSEELNASEMAQSIMSGHPSRPATSVLEPNAAEPNMAEPREDSALGGLRRRAALLVEKKNLDQAMGIIIIANTITLGIEIQFTVEGKSLGALRILEYIFLASFIAEIVLKLIAYGLRNFKEAWFLFDASLVLAGGAGAILPAVVGAGGSLASLVGMVQLFRILRLLRLLQTLKSIEYFTELWKITVGLITCFKTVMSAMVLVFATIYFFACLAMELIFKSSVLQSDPVTRSIVSTHFDSLPKAMLTLTAFTNADSIAGIYAPLCALQPLLCAYFFALWLILTISLVNVVAAVIVEKSLSSANEDSEIKSRSMRKQLRHLVPEIRGVFQQLDVGKTGVLNLHHMDVSNLDLPPELRPILEGEKLRDVFALMDLDHSGDIDEQEFVQGVCQLALSNVPIEIAQIVQLLKRQEDQLSVLENKLTQWPKAHLYHSYPHAEPKKENALVN